MGWDVWCWVRRTDGAKSRRLPPVVVNSIQMAGGLAAMALDEDDWRYKTMCKECFCCVIISYF